MTLKHFIERPVLASVISIVIVIAGIIGLATLPIEQYPDIAPPTVMVRASYPGASAETIQKSVIVPLEQAINGVENMTYITSSAAVGSASVTVYFRQGTDPDMAAVNVQNKVSRATGQLPSAVTQIGVSTMKRQTSMVKIFSLYSPDDSYDETFLSNYSKINIEPRILRIPGVGEAFTLGADYSMRVWLKPDVMAQYKLIPSDVTAALSEQNIESATGTLGENSENTFQYTMKYRGRYETPEEFGQIVIRSLPDGEVLRLKDVADIELGSESYAYKGYTNGHPGVSTMIFQTAGSNATQVVEDVEALLEEVRAELPKGIEIAHLQSVNDFLYASMNEVLKTLIEAIILVVLVVYVFLQDIRSTLVPTISILVALVGTFAFLSVAGFSINLLTLFALVLAIGTVVDDAIIVVEAVQARFDVGYKSSYHATIDAMSGITSAIVTSTLVFMAVFIPVAMMGGTSGIFYTQFGITMAVAVGISAVNALTLSPALCALLLKPYMDENGQMRDNFAARFRKAFNTTFGTMVNKYKHGVLLFIKHKWLMWSTLGLALVALVVLMDTTKTGLVPDEDQGTIMVNVTAAPGSGLAETHLIMEQVADRIEDIPPDPRLHAGRRLRHDRRTGIVLRYVYHQAQRLGRASRKVGCRTGCHRTDLRPDGRYQGCADLRRRTADDFGLRNLDRLLAELAGQGGRRADRFLQHLPEIHRRAEPASRNRTRLLDVQHQLPAVSGRHRRRSKPTCRRVAEHGTLDAGGLLRRAVRFEHQPLLEDVLRDVAG